MNCCLTEIRASAEELDLPSIPVIEMGFCALDFFFIDRVSPFPPPLGGTRSGSFFQEPMFSLLSFIGM